MKVESLIHGSIPAGIAVQKTTINKGSKGNPGSRNIKIQRDEGSEVQRNTYTHAFGHGRRCQSIGHSATEPRYGILQRAASLSSEAEAYLLSYLPAQKI